MSKSFLEKLKTKIQKIETVTLDHIEPRYYLDTGVYVFNRILSGNYLNGIPQGRVCCYAGPSGVGKSFLLCNTIKQTLDGGGYVLALDSENALDQGYMSKIGVNTESDKFMYVGVTLISDVSKVVSNFISSYKDEYSSDINNAPKVLIVLDSINMLVTDTEHDNFNSGVTKGDQGQHAKQSGTALRLIGQSIKNLNISMVCTQQVYENADKMNGKGKYLMTDKTKYYYTFIGLLEKKNLKETAAIGAPIKGFIMKCSTYKSRMNVVGASAEVEVPWDTGVNPCSGLTEMLLKDGLIIEFNRLKYTIVSTGEVVEKSVLREHMTLDLMNSIMGDGSINNNAIDEVKDPEYLTENEYDNEYDNEN